MWDNQAVEQGNTCGTSRVRSPALHKEYLNKDFPGLQGSKQSFKPVWGGLSAGNSSLPKEEYFGIEVRVVLGDHEGNPENKTFLGILMVLGLL